MSPDQLPESWRSALADEFTKPYFHQLQEFLAKERAEHKVFPPEADVFNAYKLAPFERGEGPPAGPGPLPRRQPGPRALLLGPARGSSRRRRW